MRTLKPSHIAIMAAIGAAFAFFTTQSRAAEPMPDDASPIDEANMRLQAFLHMIRTLETESLDPYNIFYGGARFQDLSDHPTITGEMSGVPLSAATCHAAGIPSGNCVSTAAGAYQFNVGTWNDVRAQSPRLNDFSPESQDEAAIRLLQKTGAYDALLADDFDAALRLASKRWASLPFSTAKQNPKSYAYALSQYLDYLEA